MAHKQYFEKVKHAGLIGFRKYPHINAVKGKILRAAWNPKSTTSESDERPGPSGSRARRTLRARHGQKTTRRGAVEKFDVFASHASEDKDFVLPLVEALHHAGIRVWYDNDMLGWGDDLRSSIDRGLANCRYGIVVFSKAFLAGKHWTEHELNGLFAKEQSGRKVILPIWHKITRRDLIEYSPAFADRIAKVSKRDSISDIVKSLKVLLKKK